MSTIYVWLLAALAGRRFLHWAHRQASAAIRAYRAGGETPEGETYMCR